MRFSTLAPEVRSENTFKAKVPSLRFDHAIFFSRRFAPVPA